MLESIGRKVGRGENGKNTHSPGNNSMRSRILLQKKRVANALDEAMAVTACTAVLKLA